MKKNILLAVIIVFLTLVSCVSINGNKYTYLSQSEITSIKKFNISNINKPIKHSEQLFIEEITGDDIKQVSNNSAFTWVFLWSPWCKDGTCLPIKQYVDIEKKYREKGLKLYIIARSYDIKTIKMVMENYSFDRFVYVISDIHYGHNMTKSTKSFVKDINANELNSFYILNNKGNIVYSGNEITETEITKIIENK